MRHIVSIWLPRWPLDRLRKHPGKTKEPASSRSARLVDDGRPFALVQAAAGGGRLYAVNRRATTAGLGAGMTLADARALVPGLKTRAASPAADRKALLRLARWCGRYTPWVSCIEAEGGEESSITLDISGCGHLFGGNEKLLQDLSKRLSAFGIGHRMGCANSLGAAWAIARFGACHDPSQGSFDVVTPGNCFEKIKEFPVAALRLEADTVALLGRLGLKTIGSLKRIPRLALMCRFSSRQQSEAVLLRLDQALGKRDEPLSPLVPAPAFRTRMAFAEPLMVRAGLGHALGRLLADLAVVMAGAGVGARRLALAAYGMDASVSRISIATGHPSRDPDHLMYLFSERLEQIDLQYGIDLIILNAERVESLTAAQRSMLPGMPGIPGPAAAGARAFAGQEMLAPLIDRLANRLGPANVGCSQPQASHIPERAERRVSALSAPHSASRGRFEAPPAGAGGALRPFRLFGRPESLEVIAEVPEGPPLSFRWRRMNIRVARAEGPERIAPEWWLDNSHGGGGCDAGGCNAGGCDAGGLRDYYRIEDTAGRRFWVYRDGLYGAAGQNGPPRWYIHGLFA